MALTTYLGQVSRYSLTLIIAGLIAGTLVSCDTPPPSTTAPNQVSTVGSALVRGNPDTLTINAVTTITAPDVTTAITQTSDRQQIIISALVDAGLKRENITSLQANLRPVYPQNEPTSGILSGYQASSMLQVQVECDSASQVATLINRMGGENTQITDISYHFDKDSPLIRNAREQAFHDARNHAEQYAELVGEHLGKVISVSESPLDIPISLDGIPKVTDQRFGQIDQKHSPMKVSVTAVWELH